MTYAEYLKSQGASEEDVKVLDTAIGRKAFDKMQADTVAAQAAAADAAQKMDAFKTETDAWYNTTILPNYTKMEREAAAAKANEARAVALIKASQDEGLRKVAEEMGYATVTPAAAAAAAAAPANFDASKFVTTDRLNQLSMDVGAGLAALQDMVLEHSQLFPDRPLNVRKIREEALAAKKDVYSYWTEKYKVEDVRTARATAATEAHDKALREEGAAAARAELATQYGNPELRPVVPSVNPFAARPGSNREKQPWEDGDRTNLRVERVMKVLGSQQSQPKTN